MEIKDFYELAKLFYDHGFNLYLVGGSVRDYLMFSSFDDADCVTNASLDDIKKFLEIKQEYKKYQSGKFVFKNKIFDITHLRQEEKYIDYRHPSIIKMVNTPIQDYLRRDFTINAMYIDKDGNLLDYTSGQYDLNNKIIKMIGDPNERIKEDPLRILRAIRFANKLKFDVDSNLKEAIRNNGFLLSELKNLKILEELQKMNLDFDELEKLLKNFKIRKYISLIKYQKNDKTVKKIEFNTTKKIEFIESIVKLYSTIVVLEIKNETDFKYVLESLNLYKNYIKMISDYKDFNYNLNDNIITIIPIIYEKIINNNSFFKKKLLDVLFIKKTDNCDYILDSFKINNFEKLDEKNKYFKLVNIIKKKTNN